jgi:hypothetical protein
VPALVTTGRRGLATDRGSCSCGLLADHLGRALVVAHPEKARLPQATVIRPFGEPDLGDELGANPVGAPRDGMRVDEGRFRSLESAQPGAQVAERRFPIGVPRAYALRAGITNFADWFRTIDLDWPFFTVADDIAEVSTARPFFPRQIAIKTPGIKERYREALGLTADDALRQTDRAHCARRAASEMFWTLGPAAVGKATLAGWRDTIRPALAESGRRYSIWPFDGRCPTCWSGPTS